MPLQCYIFAIRRGKFIASRFTSTQAAYFRVCETSEGSVLVGSNVDQVLSGEHRTYMKFSSVENCQTKNTSTMISQIAIVPRTMQSIELLPARVSFVHRNHISIVVS